jgi:hypothetical protein
MAKTTSIKDSVTTSPETSEKTVIFAGATADSPITGSINLKNFSFARNKPVRVTDDQLAIIDRDVFPYTIVDKPRSTKNPVDASTDSSSSLAAKGASDDGEGDGVGTVNATPGGDDVTSEADASKPGDVTSTTTSDG